VLKKLVGTNNVETPRWKWEAQGVRDAKMQLVIWSALERIVIEIDAHDVEPPLIE
jgi:hypothetical protein